jgi:hypothetical protein
VPPLPHVCPPFRSRFNVGSTWVCCPSMASFPFWGIVNMKRKKKKTDADITFYEKLGKLMQRYPLGDLIPALVTRLADATYQLLEIKPEIRMEDFHFKIFRATIAVVRECCVQGEKIPILQSSRILLECCMIPSATSHSTPMGRLAQAA